MTAWTALGRSGAQVRDDSPAPAGPTLRKSRRVRKVRNKAAKRMRRLQRKRD